MKVTLVFRSTLYALVLCTVVMPYVVGCAHSSPSFFVSSQTAPGYELDARQPWAGLVSRATPILILAPSKSPSVEDQQFVEFVRRSMIKDGFRVVDSIDESGAVLFCEQGRKTSEVSSYRYLPSTSHGTVYGRHGAYATTSSTTYNPVPYSYSYTVQKIWLTLFPTERLIREDYTPVWEGYIGAGVSVFREHGHAMMRTLLRQFGRNAEGEIEVDDLPGE